MTKYRDALDDLLDRPIAYNPAFKRITGRTSAAVWLSQMWYWSKRTTLQGEWFYKSAKECQEETGLTDNEQHTAREICKGLGIIEEKVKGVPATVHYRVNKSKVYDLLGFQFPTEQETEFPAEQETGLPPDRKLDSHEAGNQIPTKQESLIGTDITSETTSRNTTNNNSEKIKTSIPADIWLTLMDVLAYSQDIPPANLRRITAGVPVSFDGGVLIVQHGDPDWCNQRFGRTLSRLIQGLKPGASMRFTA
jgi:hypothetical protein